MQTKTRVLWVLVLAGSAVCLLPPSSSRSPEQWEEINFAFNSAVLVDGFPSLLRLSNTLAHNAGYKATLAGFTDSVGDDAFNEALSRARAEAVQEFLLQHGARHEQIVIRALGKSSPEATNESREGRFMNRRVVITVSDEKGREVGEGSLGSRLRPIEYRPPVPALSRPSRTASASGLGTDGL